MTDLFAARSQMGLSLAFHILFACIGMAMPFFMAASQFFYLRSGNQLYKSLTKAWVQGVAIFFAIGAVSGTAIAFELGLLWPTFMQHAGPIIGMPFSWEGTAFFLEAIMLGLFLYGEEKLNPWVHWATGLLVGVCGVASALFVVCANGWMNSPVGFDWVDGKAINIDPYRAMFNPAALSQGIHMCIAAFEAVGFAVAGTHAYLLIKSPKSQFHKEAIKIALVFGSVAAILQPLSGDRIAKQIALRQPEKLAAMESLFESEKPAALVIGGMPILNPPDGAKPYVQYGIYVPRLLSFLAHGDFNAEVTGLDKFPRSEWPPILPVHISFQIMVGCGSLLAFIGLLYAISLFRRVDILAKRNFLYVLVLCAPLGFIAVETGWVVTEVGRQPWIIYHVLKTADALTPMPGLTYTFALFTFLYFVLSLMVCWLLLRQIRALPNLYLEEIAHD